MMALPLSRPATDWQRDRRVVARLPRPTLVAWCLSIAGHAGILLWLGATAPAAPRLAAFETLDVLLAGRNAPQPRPPAPVHRAEPAPTATPASPVPIANDDGGGGERGADRDDSPLIEARYDVAALNNPKPPYPLSARRRGLEGRVLLVARVRADGRCAEVHLRTSSGHPLLDSAALDTVRRWRFLPARLGDTAIDSWVEIPINFRLAG